MEHFVPNAVDAGGNITSWVMGTDTYTYDALNRVTAASEIQQNSSGVWSGNVFTQTFSYDRWGNRGIDVASTTPNVPGVTRKVLSFNTANNRLTAIDGVAVGYDSAGNQTTFSTAGQPDYELRDYDGENRDIGSGMISGRSVVPSLRTCIFRAGRLRLTPALRQQRAVRHSGRNLRASNLTGRRC